MIISIITNIRGFILAYYKRCKFNLNWEKDRKIREMIKYNVILKVKDWKKKVDHREKLNSCKDKSFIYWV